MKGKDLLELAGDPRFIEGIYNYCDRWCERCSFTSRCLVFAQQQAEDDQTDADYDPEANDSEANDIRNDAFWEKLRSIFEQTHELITRIADERGIDLDSLDSVEAESRERRLHEASESHELSRAGEQYAKLVSQWFDQSFPRIEQSLKAEREQDLPLVRIDHQEKIERVSDAIEVIRWYQFQIVVKIRRALMCNDGEEADGGVESTQQKDSDGSIKVALIGMDRSIGAWGKLKDEFPAETHTILPLLVHLERLRRKTEQDFPNARNFVRPGFDDRLGEFVS